jgi:hypothetical protein
LNMLSKSSQFSVQFELKMFNFTVLRFQPCKVFFFCCYQNYDFLAYLPVIIILFAMCSWDQIFFLRCYV